MKKKVLGKKKLMPKPKSKPKSKAKSKPKATRKRPATPKKPKDAITPEVMQNPEQPLKHAPHEQFAHALCNEPNATRAYLKVHPDTTYEAAAVSASRLIRNANVAGRYAFLMSKSAERAIANRTELLKGYTEVWRGDITDYLTCGIDGVWYVDIAEGVPNSRAIKKIKTTTRIIGNGDDAQSIMITELELKDSNQAGMHIAKLLGLLDKDTGDGDTEAERTFVDMVKRAMDKTPGLPAHIERDLKVMKGSKAS